MTRDSPTKPNEFGGDQLRLVVEASPSGMLMVDRQGVVVLVNSQIEKLFGYTREELLGQSIELLVPESSRSTHRQKRESYTADPQARAMGIGRDLFGLRKDGTQVPVEIGLNPLVTNGERFVLASVVDISQRKASEALLQDRLVALERSNNELQQFAYVCSHDLQEPLRIITNYTQLLAKRYRSSLDDKAEQFVGFIVDASQRMQELISDLLAYSRVESRAAQFAMSDCNEIIAKALANLKLAIQDCNAEICVDQLPQVMADKSQLLQLFQNLIANAVKFRSDRLPLIKVSACQKDNNWLFSVADNGIGIEMKHAERIFVIFQRLHTRQQYPGSGIGLSICKKIVERHGGRIWFESEPGNGCCFFFTLPLPLPKV